jgi:hypothetical protein
MIVDCEGCVMRDLACGDCVVTHLLGPPEGLGSAEQVALAALADGGLVPPLRMRSTGGAVDDVGARAQPDAHRGRAPGIGRGRGAASA